MDEDRIDAAEELVEESFGRLVAGRAVGSVIEDGWCGVDLVDVGSFEKALGTTRGRLAEKCFTEREQADAGGRPERLAARWAVKEAVGKALGTGFMTGVAFREVEVVLDDEGAPSLALHGEAARVARERGIGRWSVSVSHDGGLAIAMVIAARR